MIEAASRGRGPANPSEVIRRGFLHVTDCERSIGDLRIKEVAS
jgi:hypothetical protein